jgi:carbon storage regulator
MLVLTRKSGEEIRIGDAITITVLVTGRNRVKLGISGPSQVPVVRGELSATKGLPAARYRQSIRDAVGAAKDQPPV